MESDDDKQTSDSGIVTSDSGMFETKFYFPDPKSNKGLIVTTKYKSGTRYKYVKKMRKQSDVKHRPRSVKVPFSDHPYSPEMKLLRPIPETVPISQIAFCQKREITTIQEEVLHYKHPKSHLAFKEKAYKEKVASLKLVVKRLQQTCLAKPEELHNKSPEEILKLFSKIKI